MKSPIFYFILMITLIFAILTPSVSVYAAGITVKNLNDSGSGSLRQAITDAIAGGGAEITFSVSGTINLASQLPTITASGGEITINGTGQTVIISGNNAVRVLNVDVGASLSLNNLTISDGYNNGGYGGGINVYGTLSVTNSTFSGNFAYYGGGAISNGGTAAITNSTFSGNSVEYWGGAIYNMGSASVLTIVNSTFSGNSATGVSGHGGDIYNYGSVTLSNTILANSPSGGNCDNSFGKMITDGGNNIDDGTSCGLDTSFGSMNATDPLLGPLADNGGPTRTFALLAGSPAIDGVTFNVPNGAPSIDQRGVARPQGERYDIGAFESQAQAGPDFIVNTTADTDDGFCDLLGQGLGNQDCTLREAINAANAQVGANAITFNVSGNILSFNLPNISDAAGLTIDGIGQTLTIDGGGTDIVLRVNTGASLSLNNMTISYGNPAGIYNLGTLNVMNSTFSNNNVNVALSRGGGIFNDGGTATVSNSTFSGNIVSDPASIGGGIFNDGGKAVVTNSSFSGNAVYGPVLGGGGIVNFAGKVTLRNTILANNMGWNCGGTITNGGNNIEDGTACRWGSESGSMSSTDPLLGPLADNGGPSQTFALLAGSPAIDAGDDTTCSTSPVNRLDQRGVTRPQGSACDIGAFELEQFNLSGNAGVAAAILSYTDGTPKTATADGSGNYSLFVSTNWSGTVTPSLAGYTFSPSSRTYTDVLVDQPGQDFTAVSMPGSFSKTSPTDGATNRPASLSLSWEASSNAESYEYCLNTVSSCTAPGTWISTGTNTSVALSGLAPGTRFWQVRARNSWGTTYANGVSTAWWSFTILPSPGAFNKSSPINGAINQPANTTLRWGPSSSAIAYEYCVNTTASCTAPAAWVSTGASTSVALSNLTLGIHYWQVRARNATGTTYADGSSAAWWSFTVLPLPGTFNKTGPANGATNQLTNPTLTWGASSGASYYQYCINTTANCTTPSTWISTGSATSKALSGLTPGVTYYWQVRARNAMGLTYAQGSSAAWWSFTVLPLPGAFNKITPTNGVTNRPTNLTLSWGASGSASDYQYCINTTASCTAPSTWISTGINTSVTLSGLKPYTTYYWQVRARNALGMTYANGSSAAWWSFKTAPLSATFQSVGIYDGWVRESSAGSGVGGSVNATSQSLVVGDDALNRQFRSILSFDTASLPDTAVITQVIVKVMQYSLVGTNPFTVLGGLNVDIRKPYFGTTVGLVASDFQAAASMAGVGTFGAVPASGWYTANLGSTANPYINLTGTTQFRLRFATASNNNNVDDYLQLYSGNATTAANRPVLIIKYYVP